MTDNKQEYQYPTEEFIDDSTAHTGVMDDNASHHNTANDSSAKKSVLSQLFSSPLLRKLSLVAAAIVVLVVIFKIYSHIQKTSSHIMTSSVAHVNAPVAQSMPAASMMTSNASDSAAVLQNQQMISQQSQQLTSLNNGLNAMKDNLNKLSQVEQTNITAQNQYQSMMLKLLTQIAEQQHTEIQQNKQSTIKKLSKSASKELLTTLRNQIDDNQSYKVQGIVPGLAWLVDQHGKTMSVRVGDTVDGYGKITMIDADHDLVQTSTGRIIRETS